MKTSRGFIVPLLLIVIALVFAGGGAYVYTQKKSEVPSVAQNLPVAASTAQTSDSKTADWKTYTNGALGFSIKYPTDWKIDSLRSDRTKSGSDVVFDIGQPESHESITVDTSNLSLDEWANKMQQAFVTEGTYKGMSRMTMGGQPAVQIDTTAWGQKLIGVKFDGKLYVFTTGGKMIENGMLGTFKFTPPTIQAPLVAPTKNTTKSITVIYPNGGETLQAGKTYVVRWNSSGLTDQDNVYIGIQDMNDTYFSGTTINAGETLITQGQYNWTIPTLYKEGSKYKISVYTNRQTYIDSSDNYFTIQTAPTLETGIIVNSPKPNDLVTLPITVQGQINGNGWAANEGETGLVQVFDANGKAISSVAILTATTDWLTLPTPFQATVGDRQVMSSITTNTGYLKFTSKAEKNGQIPLTFIVPIKFK
ncbi:MAG: Ser-Thr-rich GPI-anchored membrane family protein [Minisyncoccia bacterium]